SRDELVAAMMDPAFYPKSPASVTHKETHVSDVFLAGDLVYKLKKPVRYSFLDYSTLDKRRHFLAEELRLNRRLAPSVYLAVMPITCDSSGWRLGGWIDPAEYTLIMRRLPDRRMLAALLDSGRVNVQMMRSLAEVLADFHLKAEQVTGSEAAGHTVEVEREWNANLSDLRTIEGLMTPRGLNDIGDFGRLCLTENRERLKARAREGWIRDVHGDLHCEHVCFASEGIQIYDCIEFDPKLRRCDLASEVAFLLMDLEVRGGGNLRAPFLDRYLELVKDRELLVLLPFYESYRALVRAKVESLRPQASKERAAPYVRHALALTWQPLKPFLMLLSGLTGSGKSTIARELAARIKLPVVNSDTVRKELAGISGANPVAFGEGIYSEAMTEKTYARMTELAEQNVRTGEGALLDATFSRKKDREKVIKLAQRLKVPLLSVHCFAPEETTKKRLLQRIREAKDVSDGRWDIYLRQKEIYERIEEIPPSSRLELNTEAQTADVANTVEEFLRSRLTPRPVK
ncbi:MAG TPA: AAA family ATPase, partial [Candidatus Binatia bacterium]|nr:AAA family ATPase [Candidatus Binatia bacterium]